MTQEPAFTAEQKEYLEGFLAAIAKRRALPLPIDSAGSDCTAQNGGTATPEELAKREKHPFDMWDEMTANAAAGRFPKGLDVFRHKFHGLFYVAPAEDAFMLRLRLPGGILGAAKARGLADIAETYGAGAVDMTTRANLQIRGIGAAHPVAVLTALQELGVTSRGAGADNIRNLTGSPLAGIDPDELCDTRPLTRALHHLILNHREMYGLPRKFNIAFDGGGRAGVLEDTNDIGFAAVRVGAGKAVPEGVYFRMLLGGVTGHGDFAADAGVLLEPGEVVAAAAAIIRVFIAHGDRSDRRTARLKYLIERRGLAELVAEAARHLPFPWRYAPPEIAEPRGPIDRLAHIGIHRQAQPGLSYIGLVAPASRLGAAQLRGLADLAETCGSGTLRLTVWQNLIVSDIADARVAEAAAAIEALGLTTAPSAVRAGLVACTGNAGCRFALADTKRDALALADHLEARLGLDRPLNIHLTGCPNSCAQHRVADIGLLATRIDDEPGYRIFVGGGSGAERGLGRDLGHAVAAAEVPARIATMLAAYLAARADGEGFRGFVARHSDAQLAALFAAAP
jgi:ferredoxin-nitrite reductase